MLNTLSQFITSNKRDGTRYMPFAFIELGVAMLSSILNSEVVIEINKRLYRRSRLAQNGLFRFKEFNDH